MRGTRDRDTHGEAFASTLYLIPTPYNSHTRESNCWGIVPQESKWEMWANILNSAAYQKWLVLAEHCLHLVNSVASGFGKLPPVSEWGVNTSLIRRPHCRYRWVVHIMVTCVCVLRLCSFCCQRTLENEMFLMRSCGPTALLSCSRVLSRERVESSVEYLSLFIRGTSI